MALTNKNLISVKFTLIISLYFFFCINNIVLAEGTKEIRPADTCHGKLEIYPGFSPFAMYGCPPEDRLNITISNAGEKIYFGFGDTRDASQFVMNDVSYRIVDPTGSVVYGPVLLSVSGNGYINNYIEVSNGPNVFNPLGYSPLNITTNMTGDYYIEFNYQNSGFSRREFDFFDITVASSSGTPIKGRVWSKAWQFTVSESLPPAINPYQNKFYGKMYIYADDGIVTSIDFNGMQPYVFTLSSNQTGCFNTGNFLNDRKSVFGLHNYPQYKIFLNNPDSISFPTGNIGSLTAPITVECCKADSVFINISVNLSGNVELVLNLNGIPGYQYNSQDVILLSSVVAGQNTIIWNGLDGFGNPVPNGTTFEIYINYFNGLTNLPIYDVEYNLNGFKVELHRPTGPVPTLCWDDSNFPFGTVELLGCNAALGCHKWSFSLASTGNNVGDLNTVNTWWYATNISDTVQFNYVYVSADANRLNNVNQSNDTTFCVSDSIYLHGGVMHATGGLWSGGAGTFFPNDQTLDAIYAFTPSEKANGGVLLYLTTTGIGDCDPVTDSMYITLNPIPVVDAGNNESLCSGESVDLTGSATLGSPPYNYVWNTGNTTQVITVAPTTDTDYSLSVTDVNGCSGTDVVSVSVHPLPYVKIRAGYNCITPESPALIRVDTANGCVTIYWQDNSDKNYLYVVDPGKYIITVLNKYGCIASDSIDINSCTEIWVPNAFTPNGDGINDVFYAYGMELLEFNMVIYNRWGQLIFTSNNINNGWDGSFNGKSSQAGVYTYFIRYNGIRNKYLSQKRRLSGKVVLIR